MIRTLFIVFIFLYSAMGNAAVVARCDQFFASKASGHLKSAKNSSPVLVMDFIANLEVSYKKLHTLSQFIQREVKYSDNQNLTNIRQDFLDLINEWTQYTSIVSYAEISRGRKSEIAKQSLKGSSLAAQGVLINTTLQRAYDVVQFYEQIIAIRNIIDMNITAKYGTTSEHRGRLDMLSFAELKEDVFTNLANSVFFRLNRLVHSLRLSLNTFLDIGDVSVFSRIQEEKDNVLTLSNQLEQHLQDLYLPFMEYTFKVGSSPFFGDLSFEYVNNRGQTSFFAVQDYRRVDVIRSPNLTQVAQGQDSEVWFKVYGYNQLSDQIDNTQVIKIVVPPHIFY